MRKDLIKINGLQSSFLACEKDTETILRKLFIENQPFSKYLCVLLLIQTKDCLDKVLENPAVYDDLIAQYNLRKLISDNYIITHPTISALTEHEELKSRIILSFDNFVPNESNPQFRDCLVHFDIICNSEAWDLGDYRLRPLKIAGIIDGILNNQKLSGIGTLNFINCEELILGEDISGYTLTYSAIHGTDDRG